jgi:type II secretory pathway component PulF
MGKETPLSSPLTNIATWFVLAPIIVGLFLFFRVGLANPRIKYNYDMVTLKIPYLGNTMRQLSMAKFGRAFGALYKGGVPIPKAIQLSADACGNEYLRARINPAAKHLMEGEGIAPTLRGTEAFSPIVLDMVSTGETTGNLDQMLTKLAEFYEGEGETRSHQTAVATGVFIGLIVAAYIGYVVITFYLKLTAGTSDLIRDAGN